MTDANISIWSRQFSNFGPTDQRTDTLTTRCSNSYVITQNKYVFTIFQLILNHMEFRSVSNQSENGNYNLISVISEDGYFGYFPVSEDEISVLC